MARQARASGVVRPRSALHRRFQHWFSGATSDGSSRRWWSRAAISYRSTSSSNSLVGEELTCGVRGPEGNFDDRHIGIVAHRGAKECAGDRRRLEAEQSNPFAELGDRLLRSGADVRAQVTHDDGFALSGFREHPEDGALPLLST